MSSFFCGFILHSGDSGSHLLRRIGRYFICTVLVFAVSACGFLKERHDGPTAAAPRLPLILDIYQGPLNHLVAVRRGDCPMHPSCSEFGAQAIGKHGALVGWMMTLDRLLRCGRDELTLAPTVFSGGRLKVYDPVVNNDFWWTPVPQNTPP